MSRSRGRRRTGSLLFLAPIAAVGVLVVFALVSAFWSSSGTIVVRALADNGKGGTIELHVQATLDGNVVLTPYNASEPQGVHTVTFPAVEWYVTPLPHTFTLTGGKTAYAVGVYEPARVVIGVSLAGFNQTTVEALHNVTPVEWFNVGTAYVTLSIGGVGDVGLAPGQGYTTIFQKAGVATFDLLEGQASGNVTVS